MYKTVFIQTPNISARAIKPKGITLHHTAGSVNGSISWCLNPISRVSYHTIIHNNGDRVILAKDTQRAWHAGVSSFKGRSNCNDFMLGIAFGGDTTKRTLTKEEIDSSAKWCIEKMNLWGFNIDDITTHKEVSNGRKIDVDNRAFKAVINRIEELLKPKINYEVGRGDTLYSISKRFNISVQDLKRINNLTSDVIKIGQKLKIV